MNLFALPLEKYVSQSRIVHHLPGRLRLHVPLLEKLSASWDRYAGKLADIISLRDGIDSVEVRRVSGCVLIRYNPGRVSQQEILDWLEKLTRRFYRDYTDAPFYSQGQIAAFLQTMHRRVHRMLHLVQHPGRQVHQ